jgi:hypothetical protein
MVEKKSMLAIHPCPGAPMIARPLKRLFVLLVLASIAIGATGPGTIAAAQTGSCALQEEGALCPCSSLCDCQGDPFSTSCCTPRYRCVCVANDM